MPKISVIVPVYNVEKYLSKCLNSLLNQTLQDIEIICVNDGSTDDSGLILNTYSQKDARVKIINQNNAGISVSRNVGVKNSTGEFISFVDSDDWVDLDFYEKLYNAAKENDADIAVAGIYRINNKYQYKILEFKEQRFFDDFIEKIKTCDIPDSCYVWNKIYRRDALLKTGIEFISGMIYEDILYTPQVIYFTKRLVTVPNVYYYYFRHKHTVVTQSNKKYQQDREVAVSKLKVFFKKHGIDVSEWKTNIKKYKLFGLTIFKIMQKGHNYEYTLLNYFKWRKNNE